MLIGGAALVGAAFGLITQGPVVWDRIGWTSPAAHAADVQTAYQRAEDIERALAGEIKRFEDRFICEKYAEELAQLLRRQQAGDTSIETTERIGTVRRLMSEKYDCDRFAE